MLGSPEKRNHPEVISKPHSSVTKEIIAPPQVIQIYLSSFPFNILINYYDRDGKFCTKEEARKYTIFIVEKQKLARIIYFDLLIPEKLIVKQYGDSEEEINLMFGKLKRELETIEITDENLAIPSEAWLERMKCYGTPVEDPVVINYRYQDYPDM